MGKNLEAQLEEIRKEENNILKKIGERNKKKKILCGGCGESHQIKDLTLIQTHYHVPPRGEIGGDYLSEGEIQFSCPKSGVINRLLFNNYDVPFGERDKYENNPQEQFKRSYGPLFKNIVKSHTNETEGPWVNNLYIDENRKEFGLVEKREG